MSVALITGCSSGIGLETALAFSRRGFTTYGSMRDLDKAGSLLESAAQQGLAVEVCALDVTDDASVRAAVRGIEERHGAIDVLVNNAGVGYSGPVETIPQDRARAVIETNFWGPVRTCRAALPAMRERGVGVIVNIGSMAGQVPALPYSGFYAASKCALTAISQALAWEVSPFGIRVVSVEPGFFSTNIHASSFPGTVNRSGPYANDHHWANEFVVRSAQASAGDPRVLAEVIVQATVEPETPFRVLAGNAAEFVKLAEQARGFENWVVEMTQQMEAVVGPRGVPDQAQH